MKRGRPLGSRKRRGIARTVKRRHAYRMFRHAFATQLARLMDEQDVSAHALAKSLECCAGSVFGWLRGRCMPSVAVLIDASIALDCALVDLLPGLAHHR